MKTFTKKHQSKKVADSHIQKIKKRGGKVVVKSEKNGDTTLNYSFPTQALSMTEKDKCAFWVGYDIMKDEYLVIHDKDVNHPHITWTTGITNYHDAKKEADQHNAEHKKRFIKEGKRYYVEGDHYAKGKNVVKIEKIIITKKVYVKFFNDPEKYNYEILKFTPLR